MKIPNFIGRGDDEREGETERDRGRDRREIALDTAGRQKDTGGKVQSKSIVLFSYLIILLKGRKK
jgi:hypothetical protein